jgi:outer membrane lipoprotein-sorting protein
MKKILHKFTLFFAIIACFVHLQSKAEGLPASQTRVKDLSIYKNDLVKIENYLNSIKTAVAPFTQISDEDGKAEGTFYLSRPGKLRWEYNPPTPILIIAKGSLLSYYDSELNQVSHISLDENLSGFLTRENISFNSKDITILDFVKENGNIAITISQTDKQDEGKLTLKFSENNITLLGMSITDAIGKNTDIAFDTIIYDKPLDKKLFILPRVKK